MAGPDFIEIGTDDHGAAKAFFGAVFGWGWVQMGDGPAGDFEDGARRVALHDGDVPCVVPYVAVDDIEAAVGRVLRGGGTVIGDVDDAGPLGRFATCADPRGARFGLHEAAR